MEAWTTCYDYNLSYAFFKKRKLHEAVERDPFFMGKSSWDAPCHDEEWEMQDYADYLTRELVNELNVR